MRCTDPQSDPVELVEIAKNDSRAYLNPNMPYEELLVGSKKYPHLVEQNPVLALLALEDPAKGEALQQAIIEGWLSKIFLKRGLLSDRSLRLFAADCAEHVLPNFEAKHPSDDRPRKAIEVARRFANGQATEAELKAAFDAADSAADSAAHYAAYDGAYAARAAAAYAADSAAYDGAYAARAAAYAARKEERRWQAMKVKEYFHAEHPDGPRNQ